MNTIKFILKVASPYKKWILGTFFAMSLWSGYIILIPYLTKKIVDSVSSAQTDSLLNYIILYAVSIFFTNIIWRLYDLCRIQYQIQIRLDCSKILTDNLSKHSHKFFINNFIGSLTAKIHDASKALQNIIASVIEQYYYNLLSLIFAIISLSLIDYRFGIAITLWASTFISISLLVLKKFNYLSKNFFEARSVMMGQIVDFVTNISSVRLFAKQKYEINRLESKKSRVVGRFFKWQIFLIKFYSIEGFIFFVYQSFCLYLLYKLFLANKVVAGDFVMIMSLNIWIVESLFDLANMFRDTLEEWGNLSKTIELIYSNKNANDKINAVPIKITKGEIEFKNVSFGYEKKDLLFENFSLKIAPNQKVGLVGYSGSGKTSFANLILRLYDVRSGSIEIDQQDISLCKQDSLRGQIALIPQDVNLFHRSIAENISYANDKATMEEVIDAAKKAHAHEFIMNMENNYECLVGERGVKLSGGERQRIAIARAFLKDSPILILDEATSNLDSLTEVLIQDSLEKLMKNRTTIIIAHRLSTLKKVDRILVFDKGKLVQDGNHSELIAKTGLYQRLWEMQTNGMMPDEDIIG